MLSDSKCNEFASFFSEKISNIRNEIGTSSCNTGVTQIRQQSQKEVTMSVFKTIDSKILEEIVQHLKSSTCCQGPAGVPRLATRCLCLLSTWLVVCLVPCAPMSIVCPLPSCYVIIVSVAPAVSPSLPSFVSLYSSPCVCSPVLIRCLSCVEYHVSSCLTVLQSACLPACFSPSGWFLLFICFILSLKP